MAKKKTTKIIMSMRTKKAEHLPTSKHIAGKKSKRSSKRVCVKA